MEQGGGIAAVVPKKAARLAVRRHFLKRRMLACMRPWHSPSRALVAYARPGSVTLDAATLRQELEGLLVRALGPVG